MTDIDLAAAQALALARIRAPPYPGGPEPEFVILDELTLERPYGWVFFYQSREFVETGAFEAMLMGNAPVLITRQGEVHVTGTGQSLEWYLDNFERTGRVHPDKAT